MPRFDDEVLDATRAVDDEFAEEFVLRPYEQPPDKRSSPAPDPMRDTVRLRGVWYSKAINPHEPDAWDPREYRRPGVAGDVPHVEFSASATACFIRFEVREGDHIERCDRRAIYEVSSAPILTPNGTMRVPLNLLGPVA